MVPELKPRYAQLCALLDGWIKAPYSRQQPRLGPGWQARGKPSTISPKSLLSWVEAAV